MTDATKRIPYSEKYDDNYDRVKGGEEPCIICGKGIKTEKARLMIAADITCNDMLSRDEAARREAAGQQGDRCSYYYVGSDCARREDVRDYVVK